MSTNIIYRCRRCHEAPTIKGNQGADGRPSITIRCKCKCYLYRCDVYTAKQKWNEENRPQQQGRP